MRLLFSSILCWKRALIFVLIIIMGFILAASPSPVKAMVNCSDPNIQCEGGYLSVDTTWDSLKVHVVMSNVIVQSGVTLTIKADTVVKLDYADIDVYGTLVMPGIEGLGHEVIFTSLRDDTVKGDTNGDGSNTTPAAGDWDAVYLENSSSTFQYAIVKYANNGLSVWNGTSGDISPLIQHNTFSANVCGVSLISASDKNITSQIQNNVFTGNYYGFCTGEYSGTGTSLPTLSNNNFNNNTVLPIYLGSSAFPTYVSNTISGTGIQQDKKLGIGLSGTFNYSGTWVNVTSAKGAIMPYVVLENTIIVVNTTITVPSGMVIKFNLPHSDAKLHFLDVYGTLDLQSGVTFTSIRDDIAGDTNGDGTDTEPLPGDWDAVYLENSATNFSNATVKYGANGLTIWNATPGDINPPITNSTFSNNTIGIQLHTSTSYNITSLIQNNHFTSNSFGLETTQTAGVTGTSLPNVTGNTFTGNTTLPIYLAGSAFPTYSSNNYSGYPTASQRLGIGLSGYFTENGTWFIENNMPYVVLGNTIIPTGSTVTLPANLIVKFDVSKNLDVTGTLTLLSNSTQKITFTSFKDDIGGDTNGDASISQPAPGDWDAVYLENDTTIFNYAVVRYGNTGLTIYNGTSNTFNSTITHNTFDTNKTALYIQQCGTGLFQGNIANNSFIKNTGFPIELNGTAYPDYSGNSFANNLHPAIALTGYWYTNGTWPGIVGDNGQVFPYVIINEKMCDNKTMTGGVTVMPSVQVTIPEGIVFKFDAATYMEVRGTIILQSTNADPIIFTSYRDDTVKGNTNADIPNMPPARGDWDAVYLENSTVNFHDAVVNYADHGVNVYDPSSDDIAPTIQSSHFVNNNYGVFLQTNYTGNITSSILNNVFDNNLYGLGSLAFTNTGQKFFPYVGGAYPSLTNNTFTHSSGFPLYFDGTASPVYTNNFFANNAHPAIGVGGFWNADATWTKVNGDNNKIFPYVVEQTIDQDYGTITIPEALVVKFDLGNYLYAFGLLNLQSTATNPIVFTSYLDDSYGGDTNGDGNKTFPGASDWKTIWLIDSPDKINHIHNIIATHATAAIGVYYDGPANTQVDTSITDSTFSQNYIGVALAIGWIDCKCNPYYGQGNIISPITNVNFDSNWYGMVTYAHTNSTGYSMPFLNNVQFTNTGVYPIYLGGTAYPQFVSGNSFSGSSFLNQEATNSGKSLALLEKPASLDINFPDSPGVNYLRSDSAQAAARPPMVNQPISINPDGLSVSSSLAPAIGLGGVFNNTGTLFHDPNVSYAVVGNFPLVVIINGVEDPVNANLIIGRMNTSTSVTFLPGSVVKFGPGLYADVFGKLDLQGTQKSPVVFTSIHDDSYGGDTDEDKGATAPKKGDWLAVYLESSYTTFNNAILSYADLGLDLYFGGAINTNINPIISSSIFMNNNHGMTLEATSNGDILSDIHDNLFMNNGVDILGLKYAGAGRLMVTIHDNDLLGTTSYGVQNLSTNYVINALNNYWGDPTGPKHSTNPNGKGVPVSDRVQFNPWRSTKAFTQTYTVQGRVLSNDPIPVGIEGVTIRLSDGTTTTTNSGGYFSINNVFPGNYGVSASLTGYSFIPLSYAVTVPPDAVNLSFTGTLTTQPTYTISGKIVDSNNNPVNYVVVKLSTGISTATDKNGNYSFSGLLAGTYTITPSLTGYTFTPINLTVAVGPDATNQNFQVNGVPKPAQFVVNLPIVKK